MNMSTAIQPPDCSTRVEPDQDERPHREGRQRSQPVPRQQSQGEQQEPGAGCARQPRYASPLAVTEIRGSLCFVTGCSRDLPGLLPGERTRGTGQFCSLLHHSPYLARISTTRLNIFVKMKRVLKLLTNFTVIIERTPGLPFNLRSRGNNLLSLQVATQNNLIKSLVR